MSRGVRRFARLAFHQAGAARNNLERAWNLLDDMNDQELAQECWAVFRLVDKAADAAEMLAFRVRQVEEGDCE